MDAVRRLGLAAAGALVVAAPVATVTASRADTRTRLDAQPESLAFGAEPYRFDTVAEVTATSHLVVHGTVRAAGPGRLAGVDGDPAAAAISRMTAGRLGRAATTAGARVAAGTLSASMPTGDHPAVEESGE